MRGLGVALFCFVSLAGEAASNGLNITIRQNSATLNLSNKTIKIYPPDDVGTVDTCPSASWKTWKFHTTVSDYDPMNWNQRQWQDYALEYSVRSARLSIAFFLIGLITLFAAIIWRCVQWCVSCGRCRRICSNGAEDTSFLGDNKHRCLRALVFVFIAGALSMVIWGMLGLDKNLLKSTWDGVQDLLDHGQKFSTSLKVLQDQVTVTIPEQLRNGMDFVTTAIAMDKLETSLRDGLGFVLAQQNLTNSLLSSATAMRSGLVDSLMPGLATVTTQLGMAASFRRHLSTTADTSASSLTELLPQLSGALPHIIAAESTRNEILQALTDLASALDGATSDPARSASAVSTAMEKVHLADWDTQLGSLVNALEACNASRSSGPLLTSLGDAARQVLQGTDSLSPVAVAQMNTTIFQLSSQLLNEPLAALQDLSARLDNISRNVMNISYLEFELSNGQSIKVLDFVNVIQDVLVAFQFTDGSDSSSSNVSIPSLTKAALDSSLLFARLATPASQLVNTTATAAAMISSVPDTTAAHAQVNTSWRPSLATLVNPLASVSQALLSYQTYSDSSALRIAAVNASLPLRAAIAVLSGPMSRSFKLAVISAYTMQPMVENFESVRASLNTTLGTGYGTILQQSKRGLDSFVSSLSDYASLTGQLSDVMLLLGEMRKAVSDAQNQVSKVTTQVQNDVDEAGTTLEETISTVQDDLLNPGERFVSKNSGPSQDIINLTYKVWMGAWGLCALLLLVLALGVSLNWPGGLVLGGLLLLAVITASQILATSLAVGMASLADACDNVERLTLKQYLQDSKDPQLSVALSYYFYNVPDDRDLMLQAAFDVNITKVQSQLLAINRTVDVQLGTTQFQGATLDFLNRIKGLSGTMMNQLNTSLELARYKAVNPLYVATKDGACCDVPATGFQQWCALTAMATISFGALVIAAYLLARIDMLGDRRGCGSCAACVCYRPYNRYKAAFEVAEDQFTKEAQQQYAMLLAQQKAAVAMEAHKRWREAASHAMMSGLHGSNGAYHGAPVMPNTFYSIAGEIAAANALAGPDRGHGDTYSAPTPNTISH